jgi:hypothetical protein
MADKPKDKIDNPVYLNATQQHFVSSVLTATRYSAFFWGVLLGFILNALSAVAIGLCYIEVSKSGLIDSAVEHRLVDMADELSDMNSKIMPVPAKDYNAN